MPGGIFHSFDRWTKPVVDDRVVPAIKEAASSASQFVNHGADAAEAGLRQLEDKIAQSGPGKFVTHSVADVQQFGRDVRDGFSEAASGAKEYVSHVVKATKHRTGIPTQKVKSCNFFFEYLFLLNGGRASPTPDQRIFD